MKIKIKSLAAEAVIIRAEARKHSGPARASLNLHRTTIVRREARSSFLAYAYLRGMPYSRVEREGSRVPDWRHVFKIADRFNPKGRGVLAASDFNVWAGMAPLLQVAA